MITEQKSSFAELNDIFYLNKEKNKMSESLDECITPEKQK